MGPAMMARLTASPVGVMTAATTRQTVVVEDVRKDPRYLQGSSMVISEIVVPIQARGAIVGELDVESYFPSTFSDAVRSSTSSTI